MSILSRENRLGCVLLITALLMIPVLTGMWFATVKAEGSDGTTLYVGGSGAGNYATIQSAIDDANTGDTVFVYSGTYNENIVISKELTLKGEDNSTTVIDANYNENVVEINAASFVTISHFSIVNSGYSHAGIEIRYGNYNTISNCNIHHNRYGIFATYSDNNLITKCNFQSNSWEGIYTSHSSNNTISNCNISQSNINVWLAYSSNNNNIMNCNMYDDESRVRIIIEDGSSYNRFSNCIIFGVFDLDYAFNNIIVGCDIYFDFGNYIRTSYSHNNVFYINNFITDPESDENPEYYPLYIEEATNLWESPVINYRYYGRTCANSLGNYWSGYNGGDTNGDGIGDTPFKIGENTYDDSPLIKTRENYGLTPLANFTYSPGTPYNQDTIQFSDKSNDYDGTIINWTWNFGDGTISYIPNPTHQYKNAGIFTVSLQVKDNEGLLDSINKEIHITLQEYELTITVQPSQGGDITLTPSGGIYTSGSQVTLSASPYYGYTFSHWGGDTSGTNPSIQITMDADKNIIAYFQEIIPEYTLSPTITPSGSGYITFNPSGGIYDDGTMVTATATANTGYEFDHWSGDISGNNPSVQITMNQDKTITAHFKEIIDQYTLTTSINPSGNGSITLNPPGGLYDKGTTVTISAIPQTGYGFDYWSGDVTGTSLTTIVTMVEDKHVVAHFIESTSNQLPIANFTYSINETRLTFTDTSTDSDGSITAWHWDFGDDTYSVLKNPVHTYGDKGSYTVTLTVTDNNANTDTYSKVITVAAPEDEGDGTPGFGFLPLMVSFLVLLFISQRKRKHGYK